MQRSDANVSADFPLADSRTLLNIGHECALRVKFEFRISSQTRIGHTWLRIWHIWQLSDIKLLIEQFGHWILIEVTLKSKLDCCQWAIVFGINFFVTTWGCRIWWQNHWNTQCLQRSETEMHAARTAVDKQTDKREAPWNLTLEISRAPRATAKHARTRGRRRRRTTDQAPLTHRIFF